MGSLEGLFPGRGFRGGMASEGVRSEPQDEFEDVSLLVVEVLMNHSNSSGNTQSVENFVKILVNNL